MRAPFYAVLMCQISGIYVLSKETKDQASQRLISVADYLKEIVSLSDCTKIRPFLHLFR